MDNVEGPELAGIIDTLFTTIKAPDGREYSMPTVANWCARYSNTTFSREYMRQLRSGFRTNPTKRHLEALAAFFDVDVAIFFDSDRAREIQQDLEYLGALRDNGVAGIALRVAALAPDDRKRILQQIQRIQRENKNK